MHKPGDVVSRRKGLVMHRGIVLDDGSVLHNTPLRGQHVSSLSEFSKGRRVYEAQHGAELRMSTLNKVDSSERRYNPFTNNCEHTVTRATDGKARSPQLRGLLLGGALAVAGFALTRHPAVAIAGFAFGKRLGSKGSLT